MWGMTFEKSLKMFPTSKREAKFQLLAGNTSSTVHLSTVIIDFPGTSKYYESCLFGPTESEVLAKYSTLADAVEGHHKLAARLGLYE